MNRDGRKSYWQFDRKGARRKLGYKRKSSPYAEIRVKCRHIARNLLNNRVLLDCIFMHCDVNLLILNKHILAAF